jgi:hypothetical protein
MSNFSAAFGVAFIVGVLHVIFQVLLSDNKKSSFRMSTIFLTVACVSLCIIASEADREKAIHTARRDQFNSKIANITQERDSYKKLYKDTALEYQKDVVEQRNLCEKKLADMEAECAKQIAEIRERAVAAGLGEWKEEVVATNKVFYFKGEKLLAEQIEKK